MSAEAAQTIKSALEQHVRPREEAEHIRRVLALNLRSCYENGPEAGRLALAQQDCVIKTTDVRGTQRDYLKALHANIKAQRAYEEAVNQNRIAKDVRLPGPEAADNNAAKLQEHVTAIKVKRKQEKLQTIEKYLGILAQKPAADPQYMQSETIFRDKPRLPEVPSTVISGFAVDRDSTKSDLESLVDRLEKAVLRSKLLLRKEEQILQVVRSRSAAVPGRLSNTSRLAALSVTRNELITWMEAELGKASAPEEDEDGISTDIQSPENLDEAHADGQLALIKERYANYVAARKSLIQSVAQRPQPTIKQPVNSKTKRKSNIAVPGSTSHLVIPYVERLLSVSYEQKAAIAQKAHLNTVLTKQTENTERVLSHLAEESQLLPKYVIGRQQGSDDGIAREKTGQQACNRIQGWINAADSAKLATLENVAEKIEQGQIALEGSTAYLTEIDQLLGRTTMLRDTDADGDSIMDDIWLSQSGTPQKSVDVPTKAGTGTNQGRRDVWSVLNGGLGLINAEDAPLK